MNTDGLLLWEPNDEFDPLEIWCGTPTGYDLILISPADIQGPWRIYG